MNAETLQSFNDFEIEEQLRIINKPAAKNIKIIHGDTYGCVDFYKQQAFDHSSMKNLVFHYEMRRISSFQISRAKRINNKTFGYLWENGIGCPSGTVPIKRVTKDEFLRLNSFSDKYKPQGSWNCTYNQLTVNTDQHHYAVYRTKGKKKNYNGTMTITVHKVKPKQFSSSRMHIQIGEDYIQTGWTVNPALYSDSKTRNFVFTKAGQPLDGIIPVAFPGEAWGLMWQPTVTGKGQGPAACVVACRATLE
ncbi:uncharacterized protein LOC18022560 [Eutrema salsugineum]|uniref:uncharacterized protein LOC18022560 n=1 Tax=Eutrema salsugineum TaxID=72664 RepID=UPI000CED7893|nr:uncharacterized protein LOC18022560 [Eutrema salsugineum]